MGNEQQNAAYYPVNQPHLVAAFCDLFSGTPVSGLIGNLSTQVLHFECAGLSFPLTLNGGNVPGNCYICSPTSAYVDYAIDETRNFEVAPGLKAIVRTLIKACTPVVRLSGLDKQVQLNNWLFSTNPVPHLEPESIAKIRVTLTELYPDQAIVLRSLNDIADTESIEALAEAGFRMLPARQIYIFADRSHAPKQTVNMRRDLKLLRETGLRRVDNDGFRDTDYVRCEQLYNMLYLEKYTRLNPHYTARCIEQMHRNGILQLTGFRDDAGQLVAVTGLFENGRTLTQPIVGYDTTLPAKLGLYRLLMALSQAHATKHGLFFNMSAGAASFKRLRGAVPAIEYTAVFIEHLPFRQRLAVNFMAAVLNKVGIPLLRRFEL